MIRYFINVESCLKIVNSFVWFDCGALRLCYCHNIYSKSKIGIAQILNQKPYGIDPKSVCMSRLFLFKNFIRDKNQANIFQISNSCISFNAKSYAFSGLLSCK